MTEKVDSSYYVEVDNSTRVLAKATGEYAWARITDDILSRLDVDILEKDYYVQFLDWPKIPSQIRVKNYSSESDTDPFLIWCQKYEVYESRGVATSPYTTFVYRPVKKTDIPIATLD